VDEVFLGFSILFTASLLCGFVWVVWGEKPVSLREACRIYWPGLLAAAAMWMNVWHPMPLAGFISSFGVYLLFSRLGKHNAREENGTPQETVPNEAELRARRRKGGFYFALFIVMLPLFVVLLPRNNPLLVGSTVLTAYVVIMFVVEMLARPVNAILRSRSGGRSALR
jgi:hypothetical protein